MIKSALIGTLAAVAILAVIYVLGNYGWAIVSWIASWA